MRQRGRGFLGVLTTLLVIVGGVPGFTKTLSATDRNEDKRAAATARRPESNNRVTLAFTIVRVNPVHCDLSAGEGTTITYTVPTTANYRVRVKNSSGSTVRDLGVFQGAAAGTYDVYWDGMNASGQPVPGGSYTVNIESTSSGGTTIHSASATVWADYLPNPLLDFGQIIEGAGSANFNWLNDAATEFAVAFRTPKSGSIRQITMQWRMAAGYGAGTRGAFTFELQTNAGDNYPSGIAIAQAENILPVVDGYLVIPIAAELTAGEIYHLVVRNTDPDPAANWSSPNVLMTRVRPWEATGFSCATNAGGQWQPWSSIWNPYNYSGGNFVNGSHSPLLLSWTDDSYWGDPYYSSSVSSNPGRLYGSNRIGQYIFWNKPSLTIQQIGIPVVRVGSPGRLDYHLQTASGKVLASNTIATATQVDTAAPTWVYAKLPTPITLVEGERYLLWFDSPSSSSTKNCYLHYPPYGHGSIPEWLECGWGGAASYYITGAGRGGWSSFIAHDLTFSLR